MKTTVFKPLILCLLMLSACNREDELSRTDEHGAPLQLTFQWGDALSTQAANSRALVNGLGTGAGEISRMGVYVTTTGHATYPSVTKQNFTFALDNGKWASTDEIFLTDQKALIQTFYPDNATLTPDNTDGKHTIAVSVPATQTFSGDNDWEIDATDYLFGSSSVALSSVAPITAYNKEPSKPVYMHHALAKVAFSIQYGSTRSPDLENEYVKEISLESAGNTFLTAEGTMQIGNGMLQGLTPVKTLTFTATGGTERNIGYANSPRVVAYGLVAPLNATPATDITLRVKTGSRGSTTQDREYTLKKNDFKVKWQRGYCYTYNLILNDNLGVESTSVSWGNGEGDEVNGKEKGISTPNELLEFVKTWNERGLGTSGDDYTPYLDYGWYEVDERGDKRFTIKQTAHIAISAEAGKLWTPIGTDKHPLTLPFDGQGWQIILDLNGSVEKMESKYAGFIGYTKADIRNLRIMTQPHSDGTTNNTINAAGNAIYVGGLAGKVEDGNITNCSVELNGTSLINSNEGGTGMCTGGLVGWCNGNIANCAVYEGLADHSAQISYSKAGTDCYIGGLVGKLAESGSINNSYSYVKLLKNQDTTLSSPTAGWLAGTTGSSNTVINSYYMAGNMENCTPPATQAGTLIAGLTGLCSNLNTQVEAHKGGWAYWKEVLNDKKQLFQVILELYR